MYDVSAIWHPSAVGDVNYLLFQNVVRRPCNRCRWSTRIIRSGAQGLPHTHTQVHTVTPFAGYTVKRILQHIHRTVDRKSSVEFLGVNMFQLRHLSMLLPSILYSIPLCAILSCRLSTSQSLANVTLSSPSCERILTVKKLL